MSILVVAPCEMPRTYAAAALMGAARDDRIACTAAITPADLGALADIFDAQPELARDFADPRDSGTARDVAAAVTYYRDRFGFEAVRFADVVRFAKPTYTKPAPVDLRHEISVQCDVVIEALAD